VVGTDAVTLRQIRIGRRYGERTEVLAGLMAGESIATDPVAAGVYIEQQR
jgi:multidrug efflux pump subunit AcrA (membrane-fusion protein)